MRRFILFIFILLFSVPANTSVKKDYILKYAHLAVTLQHETGVPASVQIAQAIIESKFGTSFICRNTNNHFGIKTGDDWTGESFAGYRCYSTDVESWKDHAEFMCINYSDNVGLSWDLWCRYSKGYGAEGYWDYIRILIIENQLYHFDKV